MTAKLILRFPDFDKGFMLVIRLTEPNPALIQEFDWQVLWVEKREWNLNLFNQIPASHADYMLSGWEYYGTRYGKGHDEALLAHAEAVAEALSLTLEIE